MSEERDSGMAMADVYGDFAVRPVPVEKRRSFVSSFLVFSGVVICAAALWAGGAIASGLNFVQCVISCFAGFGIAAVIGGLQGLVGARHGVSTTMLSRHVFGRHGAVVVGLILAFTSIGWFAFQAGFFGVIAHTIFPGHLVTDPRVAALWGGLLMMITAIIGYRGLAFLSFLSIPLLVVLVAAGDVAVLSQVGWTGLLSAVPAQKLTLAQGITMMAGGMAVGAIIAPDVARYSRTGAHGFWSFFLALVVVNNFVVLSGAALTLGAGAPDLPKAMVGVGLGAASLVMLILAQWTTNDNNLYSSSLALLNLVRVKKALMTAALGILGSVIAGLGVANYLVPYLTWLGIYIPPIGGVMLADYFVVKVFSEGRRELVRYEFGPGTRYHGVNLLAFVVAFASGYVGSRLPGIGAINAVLLSFVGYAVLAPLLMALRVPFQLGERREDQTGY